MLYKLKANVPEFDCVDGPLAGQEFRHGKVYEEIPEGDRARFETSRTPAPAPAKPVGNKKNAVSDGKREAAVNQPAKGGDDK